MEVVLAIQYDMSQVLKKTEVLYERNKKIHHPRKGCSFFLIDATIGTFLYDLSTSTPCLLFCRHINLNPMQNAV